MADVALQHITKRFGAVTALEDVSFDVKDGEFFVLLGPTGAGKTTTLRVIAGLEKQDEGHVLFDGLAVDALPPAERDVAFVFQQYSLYPTMTVFDNMAFPLRAPLRRLPETEVRQRVLETARKVHIDHLLERKTANLSGGEMQRVAIGRALVRRPRIFLMDEPLSNLDAKLREALRVELEHLQRVEGSTTLFVTHDQVEALTMADRIAVLNHGRIIQIGAPRDIYDRPATTFVAQLVGTPRINLMEARCADAAITIPDSTIRFPIPPNVNLPSSFILGVRPEDVRPCEDGESVGQIVLTEPLGVETILHIRSGEAHLLSIVAGLSDLCIGSETRFRIVQERLHYFDASGQRIAA